MRRQTTLQRLLPALLVTALACDAGPADPPLGPEFQSFANSDWSEPVNLGPVINTDGREQGPSLSPDDLSLYFVSDRDGGQGGNDIWVSRRACRDCPWQSPANLGSPINTSAADAGPSLSIDGLLLFFHSSRAGGVGGNDIYVSRRTDPNDDFSWGPPVLLGTDVNTPTVENRPTYLQVAEDGSGNLYFNRGAQALNLADLYYAPVTRDGVTVGPAVLVAELSDPEANEAGVTIRTDGREIFFWTTRPGAPGGAAIMVSTRRSVHDPWEPPTFLPPPVNSDDGTFNATLPGLSRDGRTLLFVSEGRPGGYGGNDIWMATRTPSGR